MRNVYVVDPTSFDETGAGKITRSGAPDGHLGMRIMRDTLEDAGGTLVVASTPVGGTIAEARLAS